MQAKHWGIVLLAFLALAIGLGPIIVAKIARRVFVTPSQPAMTAPLRIKTSGTLSDDNGKIVLTTPRGSNRYLLTDVNTDQIKSIISAKTPVYVFGSLMKANEQDVTALKVRAIINVAQLDTKDFTVGQAMSSNTAEAIRKKVTEKLEYRERILQKLNLSNSGLDVVSGKLEIGRGVDTRQHKEFPCPILKDKFGDTYVLTGAPFYNKLDGLAKYQGVKMDVIAVGNVILPDPGIMVLGEKNYVTVNVIKFCNNNDELDEFVISQK